MSKITHEVNEMTRVIRRYELTDAEWERLQPYFPERQAGDKGRPKRDPREMLNGIFWILRSGSPWAAFPERYCPPTTLYSRFNRWWNPVFWAKLMASYHTHLWLPMIYPAV